MSEAKERKCPNCDEALEETSKDEYICPNCFVLWISEEKQGAIRREREKREKPKWFSKKKIPEHIRWTVWERDNFTCKHCGSRKNLTVDHIHPESRGGKLELSNLQTLCKSCNSRKGAV